MTAEAVTGERRMEAMRQGMVLALWADTKPDEPAIISPHGQRTFKTLNANANRLARALRRKGLQAGDAIALLSTNRPEFAEVVAATQRTGLRLTPINSHLMGDEAGYIVADCEARAVVADTRFAATAAGAVAQAPAAAVRLVVGGDIDGFERYDDLVGAEDGSDIDDPVLGTNMLYTSGTTGRPCPCRRSPTGHTSWHSSNWPKGFVSCRT